MYCGDVIIAFGLDTAYSASLAAIDSLFLRPSREKKGNRSGEGSDGATNPSRGINTKGVAL